MLPFAKPWTCPECTSTEVTFWKNVCRGEGKFEITKATGWWLWKVPATYFDCKIGESPKHMHMQCKRCLTRWEMLTATESPRTEEPKAGPGRPKPPPVEAPGPGSDGSS